MVLQGNKWLLYVYILVVSVYLFSISIDNELLELLFKPTLLPVLIFYYIEETKKNYSWSFILMFFSYYIGEMLILVEAQDWNSSSLIFFLFPYIIFIYKLFKVNSFRLFNFKNKTNNLLILFLFVFYCFVFYKIMDLVENLQRLDFILYIMYGILLVTIGTLGAIANIYSLDIKNNNTIIALLVTFSMSDLFFLLNRNVFENKLFEIGYVICQNFSYYYIMKYYLNCNQNLTK